MLFDFSATSGSLTGDRSPAVQLDCRLPPAVQLRRGRAPRLGGTGRPKFNHARKHRHPAHRSAGGPTDTARSGRPMPKFHRRRPISRSATSPGATWSSSPAVSRWRRSPVSPALTEDEIVAGDGGVDFTRLAAGLRNELVEQYPAVDIHPAGSRAQRWSAHRRWGPHRGRGLPSGDGRQHAFHCARTPLAPQPGTRRAHLPDGGLVAVRLRGACRPAQPARGRARAATRDRRTEPGRRGAFRRRSCSICCGRGGSA